MPGLIKFSVWTLIVNLDISSHLPLFRLLSFSLSSSLSLPLLSLLKSLELGVTNYCDSQELNNMEKERRNAASCLRDSVK